MRKLNVKYIIILALVVSLLSLWANPLPKYDDVANARHTLEARKNKQFTFFQPNAQSPEGAEPLYRYFLIFLYAISIRDIFMMKIATIFLSLFSVYSIDRILFEKGFPVENVTTNGINLVNIYTLCYSDLQ